MGKETKSRTEEETFWEERMFGLGSHYRTTISNGKDKREGRGRTPKEAEEIASKKWHESHDDNEKSSSSSGGCFISTACMEVMGFDDNCIQLNKLREFRDGYIINRTSGNKLIEEYYKIAPLIVKKINSIQNSKDIYLNITAVQDRKHLN